METVTVQLPAHVVHALKQKAQELRIPVETLVQASILEFLNSPDEEFERLVEFLLESERTSVATSISNCRSDLQSRPSRLQIAPTTVAIACSAGNDK